MYEFLARNELYVVLIIVLVCWVGLFLYLLRLDKKIINLEKSQSKAG